MIPCAPFHLCVFILKNKKMKMEKKKLTTSQPFIFQERLFGKVIFCWAKTWRVTQQMMHLTDLSDSCQFLIFSLFLFEKFLLSLPLSLASYSKLCKWTVLSKQFEKFLKILGNSFLRRAENKINFISSSLTMRKKKLPTFFFCSNWKIEIVVYFNETTLFTIWIYVWHWQSLLFE